MRRFHAALFLVAAAGLAAAPLACAPEVHEFDTGGSGPSSSSSSSSSGEVDAGHDAGCSAEGCAGLSDSCNVGACVNGACAKVPANDGNDCDDGLFCTTGTTCKVGKCEGGTITECAPSDGCHAGTCDLQADACVQEPANDGELCADGDACTLPGNCDAGVCVMGPSVDCSFLDGTCTIGHCDPQLGCKITPDDGKPCDDGLFCTLNDACLAGVCQGAVNTCVQPGDVCHVGTCDEDNHTCTIVPGNDGAACDDTNSCTSGETCDSGTCQGGSPSNEGQACDDHDGCTGGTTCTSGVCANAQSQILQCIDGDMCCPAGCANDTDCLYWVSGVQQNVADTTLTGWTMCYDGDYGSSGSITQILQDCSKAKLLMACRPTGSSDWTLLAMAPRSDVLYDCGSANNCTFQSNGVGWYFSNDYSWGFAPGGEPVNRSSCDYNGGGQTVPDQRMCWHTNSQFVSSGYRCGDNGLFDASWERAVFHAD